MVTVIDLGGSLVAPDGVDTSFVTAFRAIVTRHLDREDRRVIVVCGGGAVARRYQAALRELVPEAPPEAQDWMGIAATRLNAELLRHAFGELCRDPVVTDPTADNPFTGRVLVGAGWKPGFSTDYDAVLLAERFGAPELVRLSNVARVYSGDPRTDPAARPLDRVSWRELRAIVGDEWSPGRSGPMDAVATRRAAEIHLKVVFADGSDLENLDAILGGRPFAGTVIGPE